MRFGCHRIAQGLEQVAEQLIASATRQNVDFCAQGNGPRHEIRAMRALAFECRAKYAGDGNAGEGRRDIRTVRDVIHKCFAMAFEANGVEVEQHGRRASLLRGFGIKHMRPPKRQVKTLRPCGMLVQQISQVCRWRVCGGDG